MTCYQIVHWDLTDNSQINIDTYSLAPRNTGIETILRRVAPSVRGATASSPSSARFEIAHNEEPHARRLLESLQHPTVIAKIEGTTLAVCLDFHTRSPGKPDASRTEVGTLVYSAKYQSSEEAIRILTDRAVHFLQRNPILMQATALTTVPSSREGGDSGHLLESLAGSISSALDIPRVKLWRSQSAEKPQKYIDLKKGDDPNKNQRDTMMAEGTSGRLLIVDDLMGYGSSVREAARALGRAGASEVMALVLSKDAKGTRRYKFPKDQYP